MPTATVLLMASVVLGPRDALTGVWHNSTCVGSGYSELYAFFPDGSFRWQENQMDGVAPVRVRWGNWALDHDCLVLSVDSVKVWEGGHLEPAECSVGTDSMLVDFEERVIPLSPPETLTVDIARLRLDLCDENEDLPADVWGVDLDGSRFWRIASDPAEIDRML
jgi:hypothetical protein